MKKSVVVKRIALVVMLIAIFQLSSTSFLRVIEPTTWLNQTEYVEKAHLSDVLDKESSFYGSYFPVGSGLQYASVNFFAHKASHTLFYGVLSLLYLANISSRKHVFKIAWFLVLLTAVADEVNQYMVAGRTGMLLDIYVDMTAATIFLFGAFLYRKLRKKKTNLTKE